MNLPTLAAILGHANIQMTMRYVHPAAEEKRRAMHKFEKFRAEAIINAATAQQSHGGHYKSHYIGAGELMSATRKSLKRVARPERFEQ